jgi:excisionase family DNA binding protein
MGEYLTTGEAATLLGVSKPTVVRAIQRGMLRPALVTPGQHRRFRRDDVLAFRAKILAYPEPVGVEVALPRVEAGPTLATGTVDPVKLPA